jgi:hypothetical protein
MSNKPQTGRSSDAEILASLQSMGAVKADAETQELRELAGRVGLKGYEAETAKAKAEQPEDDEVIASLRALGVIGNKDASK